MVFWVKNSISLYVVLQVRGRPWGFRLWERRGTSDVSGGREEGGGVAIGEGEAPLTRNTRQSNVLPCPPPMPVLQLRSSRTYLYNYRTPHLTITSPNLVIR